MPKFNDVDPKVSKTMSHIKGKNTSLELEVRRYLYAHGIRYRVNYKELPGHPDIYIPKYNTVIFVNGCFWHHHNCKLGVIPKTRQEYWIPKLEKNVENDIKNQNLLRQMRYKVIVVWECELKEAFENCMEDVISSINDHG